MNRALLSKLVVGFSLVGAAAFGYVLTRSLSPTDATLLASRAERGISVPIATQRRISPGEIYQVQSPAGPIFIFRPTDHQLSRVSQLDDHVWDSRWSGYDDEHGLFIYRGVSTNSGCVLQFEPVEESSANRNWYGGYFDVCRDSSYDFAGRTIRTPEYTKNGYNLEVPNLRVPEHEFQHDGSLSILP